MNIHWCSSTDTVYPIVCVCVCPSDRSVHHSSQILTSDQETEFLATEESQCYSDTRRVDTGTLPSRRCSSLDLSNAADAAAPSPAQPQSICNQKKNMLTFTGQHRPPCGQ